jgi:geranylgeranyl diphosphate synthase type I
MTLDQRLAELAHETDGRIREAIAEHVSPRARRLAAMMEYHLGWRGPDLEPLASPAPAGKKLRPALTLLACLAVSGEINHAALDCAAAVELVHNFSLVHDDIQDRSELRRFRPTVWSLFGLPQAINVGDALFALAQLVITSGKSDLSARLAAELGATAVRLAEGQFLDIDLQDGTLGLSLDAYEEMIGRKTAMLFACACRLGALSAGADGVAEAYADFGQQLGIAFQEQDDLLGVWGSPAETGKPEAADVVERKRGLPAVMALGRAEAPDWLRAIYLEHDGDLTPDLVQRVIAHFDTLGLRKRIERRVEERYRTALERLEAARPCDPARSYLVAISEALVARRT